MAKYIGTMEVDISIDEGMITEAFLADFSANFDHVESVEDIRRHLAQLWFRGMVDNETKRIEGFGNAADYGIRFRPSSVVDARVDLVKL